MLTDQFHFSSRHVTRDIIQTLSNSHMNLLEKWMVCQCWVVVIKLKCLKITTLFIIVHNYSQSFIQGFNLEINSCSHQKARQFNICYTFTLRVSIYNPLLTNTLWYEKNHLNQNLSWVLFHTNLIIFLFS